MSKRTSKPKPAKPELVRITVQIPATMRDTLNRMAEDRLVSLSDLVRQAIAEEVK
jgi:metal-responsive CopG/Arc/MetJ family transcriptional regulator